jgi:hypothetical protein
MMRRGHVPIHLDVGTPYGKVSPHVETFENRDPSARWIFFDPAPPS